MFVGNPKKAPQQIGTYYAKPDDLSDGANTWRDRLVEYNRAALENPLSLLPAYKIYKNNVYQDLVSKFGIEKVFILSAGWGLVAAGYLLPDYDITFSATAETYKRRTKQAVYRDFSQLDLSDADEIIFLGGKDYLPLLCSLMKKHAAQKLIYYNSAVIPSLPAGYRAIRYPTTTRTNWHYQCANDLIAGRLERMAF